MLDLVDKRINVLYPFQIDAKSGGKETVLRWCQGLVLEVCEDRSKPVVNIEWGSMPDIDGYEDSSILKDVLLPSKCKKDVVMSRRMNVDTDVDEGEESENEMENETESEIDSEIETKEESAEEGK